VPLLDGVRILCVEDDADTRDMLKTALELRGARMTCVPGVPEAWDAIGDEPPDVVLSDLALSGESGHQFLSRLRALPWYRGGTIPAIALSAHGSRDDRLESRNAGFAYHLDKPVDIDKLAGILAALVRKAG